MTDHTAVDDTFQESAVDDGADPTPEPTEDQSSDAASAGTDVSAETSVAEPADAQTTADVLATETTGTTHAHGAGADSMGGVTEMSDGGDSAESSSAVDDGVGEVMAGSDEGSGDVSAGMSDSRPRAGMRGTSDAAYAADGGGDDARVADEAPVEPGQTEIPVEPEEVIDDWTMRRALEAILMVADEPLPSVTLAQVVGRPTGDVAAALAALSAEYGEQGRGFDLREVAGGWRYYTREEAAPYVERFVLDGQQARLTQAALETLAVVAYKQPVSRARVSAIRGVNVDGVMRTLVSRGLVEEAGADTESQATLYRTTSYFLERMGMQNLDDLPELAPYLPEMDDIEDELARTGPQPAPAPAPQAAQPEQEVQPEQEAQPEQDEAERADD
ncbi:MAG: SMC-Scp complex subunit ScpB [Kribbellaceae bacterium]